MIKEIDDMITLVKEGIVGEQVHWDYDRLLEKFILNYDERLLDKMKELIELEKKFWYS